MLDRRVYEIAFSLDVWKRKLAMTWSLTRQKVAPEFLRTLDWEKKYLMLPLTKCS